MPMRPARMARRAVIGAPVARTAAVVGTAKVVEADRVARPAGGRGAEVVVGVGIDPPLIPPHQALERVQVAALRGTRQRLGVGVAGRLRAESSKGPICLHRQELHAGGAPGCYPPC